MSQQDLADVSGVAKKTIARAETGKSAPTANTVKRLASALKVPTEALFEEPSEPSDTEPWHRESGYRPLKTLIDGETALAFEIVERLYGIPIRSQVLMAPLFAALLAEASFAWRREKLAAIDESAERLMDVGRGHLSFAKAVGRVQDGAAGEKASIASRDLFGNEVGEDAFNFGYDASQDNPFARYLQAFATQSGATEIEIDCGIGPPKTEEGLPEYRIATDFIEKLSGGDRLAEFALLHGHALISDIPDKLMGEDAMPERIAWLASQIPAEVRARQEKYFASIKALAAGFKLKL